MDEKITVHIYIVTCFLWADVSIENPVADLLNDWTEQDILNKNIDMTYSVEVIYDGETYSWEFLD